MSRSALRLLTTSGAAVTGAYVLGAAGLLAGLAGLVLGLTARRSRVTVEEPARETVTTGAK